MALIECPECGKEISDKARSCPNCGCPINRNLDSFIKGRINKKIIIVFSAAVLLICISIFFSFRNRIPDGFTKEYYQEAKEFVKECEIYIDNPSDDNYPQKGFYYDKVIEDMIGDTLNYTYKDYELAEQELFTSTALLRYSIDNEKEEFVQAVNQMKKLMELD